MKPLVLAIVFGLISSPGKIIDFDSASLGKMPPGWVAAVTNGGPAPKWEVRRDISAPTQPYVFAQVSKDPANHFPLAILDTMAVRNGDISVRVKPLGGHSEQVGGLVFRYRDPNNYYVARANALDHTVGILRSRMARAFRSQPECRTIFQPAHGAS